MVGQHNCRNLIGDLSDYLDGELNTELCAEIERHLADCENCRIVVDTLRRTIYLVHATAEPEPVPDQVRDRLFKSLDINEFIKP